MKRIFYTLLCMLLIFTSFVFTSCSEDENVIVSEKTSVVLFSQTINVKNSEHYSVKCNDTDAKAAGDGYTITAYKGEEIRITVNMHNFGEAYAEHFDNDESFEIITGCSEYGKDTQFSVTPELSFEGDECYMSVSVRCIVTDASGMISVYLRTDKFNIDRGQQPSLFLSESDRV